MSIEDPVATALRARLEVIQQELDRLVRLAAAEKDDTRRQQYWDLARDVQDEGRRLREEFSRLPPPCDTRRRESLFARLRNSFRLLWRNA